METWLKTSILLCIFGVLKEFRPSEPYCTKYLANPPMNFTLEKISSDIYPVAIYTTVISLIFIFLLTDILRHKPVIAFHILCGVLTYILFIFGRNLLAVQLAEMFYGLFMASEIAYFTYIYAKVDKSHYQKVSGHTRAAHLAGRCLAGLVGQVLLLYKIFTYYTLNYITLASTTVGALWVFLLPPVSKTVYLNRINKRNTKIANDIGEIENEFLSTPTMKPETTSFVKQLNCLREDFSKTFSNFYIAKWVFWSALASCGYYQVLTYIQVLWEEISADTNEKINSEFNGIVETVYTLLSAGVSYGVGYLNASWALYGEIVLCISSLLSSLMLFLMYQTKDMLFAYGTFILYVIIYHGMATVTNAEIAKSVNEDSHGLIFGFTSFLGFIFQSFGMMIVNSYLSLSGRSQFCVYSCYFGLLGTAFGVISFIKCSRHFFLK